MSLIGIRKDSCERLSFGGGLYGGGCWKTSFQAVFEA